MANISKSSHNLVTYKGFIDALRILNLLDQYPKALQNGSCYVIENVTVNETNNIISIIVKLNGSTQQFCSDYQRMQSSQETSSNGTKPQKDKNPILAISQLVGIIICAILLGIFFFIAGIMRLKNYLRRNNNNFKLAGLRSCLTNGDESQKWRAPMLQPNLHQSTISNYLQLQSVIDKNVSQFMMRSNNYAKSSDQEAKRPNPPLKRKLSLKNKLLPKRLSSNQNSQRRYSLSNEIESVMNKHFNMIGVTRKYGSKSTQNIGGTLITPISRLSQHSMLNEMNFGFNHKDGMVNNVNDVSSISTKSLSGRYQRCGNFPGRRATTIGTRSNNSRPKLSLKYPDKDSSPTKTIYSSHNSVIVPQTSKHGPQLKKQLTLQEGNECQAYDFSIESSKLYENMTNKTFDKSETEACYLKVPFESLNLLPNKKCIFQLSDEKTSPSPESRESNSRCSSFDKASSTWSSLEIQEGPESKNNNNNNNNI